VPSLPADTRWRPWAAVSPQLLKAERAEDLRFQTGALFLLLSHARKKSPSSPGAEWNEKTNGEVSVPSQILPAIGFFEQACGGSIEAFLVLGCGLVARLI